MNLSLTAAHIRAIYPQPRIDDAPRLEARFNWGAPNNVDLFWVTGNGFAPGMVAVLARRYGGMPFRWAD